MCPQSGQIFYVSEWLYNTISIFTRTPLRIIRLSPRQSLEPRPASIPKCSQRHIKRESDLLRKRPKTRSLWLGSSFPAISGLPRIPSWVYFWRAPSWTPVSGLLASPWLPRLGFQPLSWPLQVRNPVSLCSGSFPLPLRSGVFKALSTFFA